MRPQWFVRPPSMRDRNQSNVLPAPFVYGSPSSVHPPNAASNSPNCCFSVAAPRRGESYVQWNMYESAVGFHIGPASSMSTLAPASVSTFAAMPPPAPEPTMQTS